MREIIVRGKCAETGDWLYGTLFTDKNTSYIISEMEASNDYGDGTDLYATWWAEVAPKSVGQSLGRKDKNGKDFYAGDVIKDQFDFLLQIKFGEFTYVLQDNTGHEWKLPFVGFYAEFIDSLRTIDDLSILSKSEIVGNIHDNPELLETKL